MTRLGGLVDQRLVDVRDHAAASNGGLDERVELLVATNGELQVPRSDALHLQVLGRVARQLEHLCRQVLEDRGRVHGGGRADALAHGDAALQEPVDAADWELEPGARRAGLRGLLGGGGLASLASLAALASLARHAACER